MLRRVLLAVCALAAIIIAGCGASPSSRPHGWVSHVARSRALTACVSADCGPYNVTFDWVGVTIASRTGYYVALNGSQVADQTATQYTFAGIDCGTTSTFSVEAHNGSATGYGSSGTSTPYSYSYTTPACPGPAPLQVSGNGRYLETSTGAPFLMVGDSPQSLIGNNSVASATSYFADRVAHGFNTVWINLLCDDYTFCNSDGTTYDSIKPFNTGTSPSDYDLSTPNSTYFARAFAILTAAKNAGLIVFLDPIETGGWQTTLDNATNGDGTNSTTDHDYKYGQFLGCTSTTYSSTCSTLGSFNNIVWLSGNDFGGSSNPSTAQSNNAYSVANGIKSVDSTALQTAEDHYVLSQSWDLGSPWTTLINLNAGYTYDASYDLLVTYMYEVHALPGFLIEANYEAEHISGADGCAGGGVGVDQTATQVRNCRLQYWWTMTSGATGQFYGSYFTDRIANGWSASDLDSPAVQQLQYQTSLLSTIAWYNLAPISPTSSFITSGDGTYSSTFLGNTYVTAAQTSDKTLALVYMPTSRAITVDMSQMSGTTTARWYDPTDGMFTTVPGSPFTAASHALSAPGNNSIGDSDWVLVLQS